MGNDMQGVQSALSPSWLEGTPQGRFATGGIWDSIHYGPWVNASDYAYAYFYANRQSIRRVSEMTWNIYSILGDY